MTILQKINQRERQLLVHSYLYYRLGKNLIDDDKYDQWSFELNKLIKDNPQDFKQSVYYNDFKSFEPSSGYYLEYNKPEIRNVALRLLKLK